MLFIQFPFWGLEYEDSFIYTDTGRYLNYSYDYESMPFKCLSCLDGSYVQCYEYGSFGGHFLTIPLLLSIINSIIGYHFVNIFFLNLTVSLFILCLVYYCWNRFKFKDVFSLNIFLGLLCITPFVSIFHTSGLAETISSFFVIGFLFSICYSSENNFKVTSYVYWLTIVFMVLAVVTKRENFVLLVFMYLIPIIRILYKQKPISKSFLFLVGLSTLLLLSFSIFIGLFGIENNESGDIGSKTFSIQFLVLNLKQLMFAITNIQYWGITGFAFLIAIIIVLYTRRINKLGLMSLVLSILYILIYSTHYRSYYQVVYNLSHPFETLRYSTNYLPLIILFISTVKFNFKENFILRIFNSKLGQLCSVAVFIGLILNVVFTRIDLSQDEYNSRIQPVQEMLEISNNDDIIVSNIPIVFRCFADEKQRVVDIFSLENDRLSELISTNPNSNIYILKPKDMKIDSDRYDLALDYTDFNKIEFASLGFELFKYVKK